MKRFIAIPIVLSVFGHGLFFGLFKQKVEVANLSNNFKLYIIPSGQIRHEFSEQFNFNPFTERVVKRNILWGDKIQIIGTCPLLVDKNIVDDKDTIDYSKNISKPEFKKIYIAKKISYQKVAPGQNEEKLLPRFSRLFYDRIPDESLGKKEEESIDYEGGIKLDYYIQGPASLRKIKTSRFPLDISETSIKLKLRFWIDNRGKINQVVIEEGSGFAEIDMKIIDIIKKWEFDSSDIVGKTKYQWGVMKIRVQG